VSSSFNLDTYTTVDAVKGAVLSLNYVGGIANTAGALSYVRTSMLTSAAGDRGDVPNVIIILTNGPSSDPMGARVSTYDGFPLVFSVFIKKNVISWYMW